MPNGKSCKNSNAMITRKLINICTAQTLKNKIGLTTCVTCPLNVTNRSLILKRHYCQKSPDEGHNSSHNKSSYNRFGKYLFHKFHNYVKGYEKILETKFPKAFLVYQVFAVGIKELYHDSKLYGTLLIRLNQGKQFSQFSRFEIEKYYSMPKEIKRVTPVLLISALPFANYVIFPLAYLFPKKLLSSHFWSLQQKIEFATQDHKLKLLNYRPVFRHLQAKVDNIEDATIKDKCAKLLFRLGSGTHPSVPDILSIKDLFITGPYSMDNLSFSHISGLSRMHNLSVFGLRRRRLKYHAKMILEMDLAIVRENIQTMNLDELRSSCFIRGVNPIGMTKSDMLEWLTHWIRVSSQINESSLSLLLHCPILLSYNYPTNWILIH